VMEKAQAKVREMVEPAALWVGSARKPGAEARP
jgi:hypothetical protein